MHTKNSTLKNLLLTASLISTSAFLMGCGDSDKGPITPIRDLAQADLSSDIAKKDAQQKVEEAVRAAEIAANLQPENPAAETSEQRATRVVAEEEAARAQRVAREALKKQEVAEQAEIRARSDVNLEALKEKVSSFGKRGQMDGIIEVLKANGVSYNNENQKIVNLSIMLRFALNNEIIKINDDDELKIATQKVFDIIYRGSSASQDNFKVGNLRATEALVEKCVEDYLRIYFGFVDTGGGASAAAAADDDDRVDIAAADLTDDQVVESVTNLKNGAIIVGAFSDVGLAPMPPAGVVNPMLEFLVGLDESVKKTLINAKTDTDYTAFIDALKGNAAINAHIADDKKLGFAKALQKRAIAKTLPLSAAMALSAGIVNDLSGNISFREARTASSGLVDSRSFAVSGVNGQVLSLEMPLFVNLKGRVGGTKSTEAAIGSVAYRLGNTVIGAIQGYANSGAGFGVEGRQFESSVVASHSFGSVFIEGQAGSVAAANVHGSDWNGYRSQVTVGFDTAYVSPFVQVSHRQLDRDEAYTLNETAAYVGLDMEVANVSADTYSLNTRLLTKVGYGEKNWSKGSKDVGASQGFRGSVEWTAGVNLNSGISFSTNLGIDTLSGSSAGLTVGLDR